MQIPVRKAMSSQQVLSRQKIFSREIFIKVYLYFYNLAVEFTMREVLFIVTCVYVADVPLKKGLNLPKLQHVLKAETLKEFLSICFTFKECTCGNKKTS